MKILIAGALSNFCLETSYLNGFRLNGHEVLPFDIKKHINKYVQFGKAGSIVNTFLPVDAWIHKANRELVIEASKFKPDVMVCAANNEVLPGSIAFLKSIMPVKIVLIWPDTLFNLGKYALLSAPFYDLVATHSSTAVNIFKQYGFKKVEWVPFAGDIYAHHDESSGEDSYEYDLTFVGGARPEREKVIDHIIKKLPGIKLKIWGPYWNRTNNKLIKKVATPTALYGKQFTGVVKRSFLNLNIIDETNYPACNMRFFEIPTAGGLQLCSSCPEMEPHYREAEHLYYYHSEDELISKIEFCLNNRTEAKAVANSFHKLILEKDNYGIRSEELLQTLIK